MTTTIVAEGEQAALGWLQTTGRTVAYSRSIVFDIQSPDTFA